MRHSDFNENQRRRVERTIFRSDKRYKLRAFPVGVGLDIEVTPIKTDDLVKNLLKPHIEDQKLNGQRVDIGSFGQGLQRHLFTH